QDVMLIGIRDLDTQEREMLRTSGAGVYTMREIDDRGIGPVAREAVKRLEHLPRVHVSLDLDALDPREAPGVGTPVTGGLTYREAHLLMEIIAETITVGSIDIVEVNPILDHSNRTAELAIELLLSLLGKTII
ncbi:MAG: arginase family protein, partial [Acidobacteriota bacterium]